MTPTTSDTAATVIRILGEVDRMAVSRVYERLSQTKKIRFSEPLDLLVERGQVTISASPGGGWRRLHLIRPILPNPHCPTCTCNDVL